ncbi:MAG: energy transducer TonB [Pseudomonadaceae bacterium]|nr:energy transducer TonB [Pseudomonadaceae bacterium]
MIAELRRRAYLSAMQVASWLPRVELPFAAPSRPELLQPLVEAEPEVAATAPQIVSAAAPAAAPPLAEAPIAATVTRAKIEVPRLAPQGRMAKAEPVGTDADEPPVAAAAPVAPPRFALQLLRAGACAVLVELPTGEPLQGRDPAYLLLKDLLRAAGLPDSPQLIGEPVRWPLLARGQIEQGPQAALDYVQSFVGARLEEQEPCRCLWLVGLPAIRFAADATADAYNRELQIEGLGAAWALPGLELLMDEPERKRELWQAMRRVRQRWLAEA